MSVESTGASRLGKSASATGGLAGLAKGWLTGKYLTSDRESSSASGSRSGGGGKTAADWHNEEVSKQHEFGRQGTRREWSQADSSNPRYKQVGYGADGGVNTAFYPAATPRAKSAANRSSGGQGTSGNAKGNQFNKPMPAFSVAGSDGKRAPNPEYGAWKTERDQFNAKTTKSNVKPVGLADKPGTAPKPVGAARAPRRKKA